MGKQPLGFALGFILLAFAAAASAQMYRVVGADGRVTYTDRPPEAKRAGNVRELIVPSYPEPRRLEPPVGTSAANANAAQEPAASPAPGSLVMYSTQSCGYCKRARSYMTSRGIAYREVDVERDRSGAAEFARLGGRGVPLFSVGRQTLAGFSPDSFEAFLRNASR